MRLGARGARAEGVQMASEVVSAVLCGDLLRGGGGTAGQQALIAPPPFLPTVPSLLPAPSP